MHYCHHCGKWWKCETPDYHPIFDKDTGEEIANQKCADIERENEEEGTYPECWGCVEYRWAEEAYYERQGLY